MWSRRVGRQKFDCSLKYGLMRSIMLGMKVRCSTKLNSSMSISMLVLLSSWLARMLICSIIPSVHTVNVSGVVRLSSLYLRRAQHILLTLLTSLMVGGLRLGMSRLMKVYGVGDESLWFVLARGEGDGGWARGLGEWWFNRAFSRARAPAPGLFLVSLMSL